MPEIVAVTVAREDMGTDAGLQPFDVLDESGWRVRIITWSVSGQSIKVEGGQCVAHVQVLEDGTEYRTPVWIGLEERYYAGDEVLTVVRGLPPRDATADR